MDSEEEIPISKSVEGNEGWEAANMAMPLDEIRADSYDEIAPEEPHRHVRASESLLADPAISVFESSVEGVGSPPARPVIDESILVEPKEFNCYSSQSSPSDTAVVESKPVVTKGSGLRKWRRIKRDLKKDGSSSADSAHILKRRLTNSNPSKSDEENKLKSKAEGEGEDSALSLESRKAYINSPPVGTGSWDPELEQLASGGFSIGVDSDNSEDHSSKSSTATSAPRLRHEVLASGKERGRRENVIGRGSSRLGYQKVQQSRDGTVDVSKNTKGDLARFEKENSLSSVESDLRSSVVGVMQWDSVSDSKGKHNGSSLHFGEHSDEADKGQEVRSGYYKENGKAENLSRDDLSAGLLAEKKRSENLQSSSDVDPFFKSIIFLQEAQEALEKEIEEIAATGKENDENSMQFEGIVAYTEKLEACLVDLRKKAENLKSKLEEASTLIETKEQKLRELEAQLSKTHSPKMEGATSHVLPIQAHEKELDSELDALLVEKIEAEIEYLIISRTIQNWKILHEDQIALFKEQKYLAGDQEQMMLKLREAEDKIILFIEQKGKLEAYCKDLVETENVLRLQNKVCKFSLCIVVQLIIFSIAFGLFLMQLSPIDGVMPT